jgi:hypothetical protein
MTKMGENLQLKNKFDISFLKISIYLFLGLHKGRPSYREKPSALKMENPAIQNMKFLNFFLILGINSGLLDPDPLV